MKRTTVERNIVVLLFIAVITVFSLAERDTKKIEKLYTANVQKGIDKLMSKLTLPSEQ